MSVKLTKALLRWVIAPILRPIAYVVFDRRYIRGRYFDKQVIGWVWVFRSLFVQKLLGLNRSSPWPVGPFIRVSYPQNIFFDPDDLNNFQTFGCYFQANVNAKIILGKGTYIAPNVGLITANHDPCNLDKHLPAEDIRLGKKCWIGMNSVIMPGVTLGDHTVVGAGSVVTHSFIEGNCLIAGVPAKFIKSLECQD